jgi:hypothetical protein
LPTQVIFSEVLLKYRDLDCEYSRTTTYPDMVVRIANYPDRLGPLGKFVENSTELTFLEVTVSGSSTVQCYGF